MAQNNEVCKNNEIAGNIKISKNQGFLELPRNSFCASMRNYIEIIARFYRLETLHATSSI